MNPSEETVESQAMGPSVKEGHSLRVKRKIRHVYDRIAGYSIAVGGIGIIATMLLIFLFLIAEVRPLFESATILPKSEFSLGDASMAPPLHTAFDEQGSLLLRIGADGNAIFADVSTGRIMAEIALAMPLGDTIQEFAADFEESGVFAYSTNAGDVFLGQYSWELEFSAGSTAPTILPRILYPLGQAPALRIDSSQAHALAVSAEGDGILLAATTRSGGISLFSSAANRNLLSDFSAPTAVSVVKRAELGADLQLVGRLFIGGDKRLLYVISETGLATVIDLRAMLESGQVEILTEAQLIPDGVGLQTLDFVAGGLSLLVGNSLGEVVQWFVVRSEGRVALKSVQTFSVDNSPVAEVAVEPRRKNFLVLDHSGRLSLFNLTSQKRALSDLNSGQDPIRISISPRGNTAAVEFEEGRFASFSLDNPHPEVSFSALWQKIWYESYPEPDYVWQSSAASSDFEPKYSLMPLTFGTLKAAFFAMLLAAPLAICGAIYTGYFMAPPLRRKVKPLIELMEALPTVVLGFLAGLWLAPFVEVYLLGVLSLVVCLPIATIACSFLWAQLPKNIRYLVPEGWEAVLLLPVMVASCWFCLQLSAPLESLFFDGDLKRWLNDEWGITYAQRNAMIVGIVMGFAVIPTIYSIAEDAIFTVPRHLSDGSLALGATSWQSLYHVVLPTASPGIFSATMIGLGRAVGETMIILMATGNTPIMDFNVFEGMRTLAATIAIEVPESEVSSTHYRILFLAATVLFLFTFVVNTVAEVVRQQLRQRYSNI